jgi:hypothetical protein
MLRGSYVELEEVDKGYGYGSPVGTIAAKFHCGYLPFCSKPNLNSDASVGIVGGRVRPSWDVVSRIDRVTRQRDYAGERMAGREESSEKCPSDMDRPLILGVSGDAKGSTCLRKITESKKRGGEFSTAAVP